MIGIPIARILGIEIRVQLSWIVVLALIAVIAVIAGVRAGICMIAVPTLMRSVFAAIQVAAVTASLP